MKPWICALDRVLASTAISQMIQNEPSLDATTSGLDQHQSKALGDQARGPNVRVQAYSG